MILDTNISNKLEELIPAYFEGIKHPEYNEIYKWNAVIHFQNTFDINAPDFPEMLENSLSKTENLLASMNYYPKRMINRFAKELPVETRQAFSNLYDEDQDLVKRINLFKQFGISSINKLEPGRNLSSYQDDRTIAVYLSLKYPEKYYLYKSRMISDFCKKLNIVLPKEEALVRYWKLADEIKVVLSKSPLIENQISSIVNVLSEDANLNLLVQDFIWTISNINIEKESKSNTISMNKKYWLFSPGEKADMWEEFKSLSIIGIEVDALGNLKNYPNKPAFSKKLQELDPSDNPGSKKNDSTACDEFTNKMSVGDVVIVKTKQKSLLGYGIVTSDYYFDDERQKYKSCRKVEWKKTGNWTTDFQLVQKTLTDVTKYTSEHPNYNFYYERLMAIIGDNYTQFPGPSNKVKHSLNQILFGPPGTGKTYNSINHALAIVESKELEVIENESNENRKEIIKRFQSHVDSGQVVFTTFHQSMSYEDFIEGIKPIEAEGQLQYDVQRGVFRILVDDALTNFKNSKLQNGKKSFESVWVKFLSPLNEDESIPVKMKKSSYQIVHVNDRTIFFDKNSGDSKHSLSVNTLKTMYDAGENQIIKGGLQPYYEALLSQLLAAGKESGKVEQKNYVLIIDEINRGNVAQIFGELITLIEPDKRNGNKESLSVTLPYSKKKDFSIPPNLYIVGTMNTADRSVEALDTALRRRFTFIEMPPKYDLPELEHEIIDGITLEMIMKTLNARIEKLLDKDHLIGHSYFLSVDNLACLNQIFHQNIIPLLQEYFYGDFAKIGLVLGEAFFEKNEVSKKTIFARFEHDAKDELNEKSIYRIKQTWAEGEFEKAIEEMVNPKP